MPVIKKPALGKPGTPDFLIKVKMTLDIITGRTGGDPVQSMEPLGSKDVTAPPTAEEYNQLRSELDILRVRFNKLLKQIGD